jgi:hypothetical protein
MKFKSVLCESKKHHECLEYTCECSCHHEDDCHCFACRIKTVGFKQVPGGYKTTN